MSEPEHGQPAGWCPQRDWVADGKRKYRCSACNRRLLPRMVYGEAGEFTGWRLPPHKPKGYKIKKKKRQRP